MREGWWRGPRGPRPVECGGASDGRYRASREKRKLPPEAAAPWIGDMLVAAGYVKTPCASHRAGRWAGDDSMRQVRRPQSCLRVDRKIGLSLRCPLDNSDSTKLASLCKAVVSTAPWPCAGRQGGDGCNDRVLRAFRSWSSYRPCRRPRAPKRYQPPALLEERVTSRPSPRTERGRFSRLVSSLVLLPLAMS